MSEREQLLAAILAHPDEDTPRLMYADHLEEHGRDDVDSATAEFIRLSCTNRPGVAERTHPTVGKWIYRHWGRLLPQWEAWVGKVHEQWLEAADWLRPFYETYGTPIFGTGGADPAVEPEYDRHANAPNVVTSRHGRWMHFRLQRHGLLSEVIGIEFWRGFVRKVQVRMWEWGDLAWPLILADAELCEPIDSDSTLRSWPERTYAYRGLWHLQTWRYLCGMGDDWRGEGELLRNMSPMPEGFAAKPIMEYATHHFDMAERAEWRGEGHEMRAYYAMVMAGRWRAAGIVNGFFVPGQRVLDLRTGLKPKWRW